MQEHVREKAQRPLAAQIPGDLGRQYRLHGLHLGDDRCLHIAAGGGYIYIYIYIYVYIYIYIYTNISELVKAWPKTLSICTHGCCGCRQTSRRKGHVGSSLRHDSRVLRQDSKARKCAEWIALRSVCAPSRFRTYLGRPREVEELL